MKNKQKEKIKKIILSHGSPCGFDMDGAVDELSSLVDSIREETIGEVDVLKMAEEFEVEMTSGFGLVNIHGMGNVHLFAQKVQNFINNLINKK